MMDEGLEEMWIESSDSIATIDPGECNLVSTHNKMPSFLVSATLSVEVSWQCTITPPRFYFILIVMFVSFPHTHTPPPTYCDTALENWKVQTLPLARIKKIMKSEEFILQELEREKQEKLAAEEAQSGLAESEKPSVKFMISGEAPVLMSKACELLIKDLSFRAWRHTERNRRRTLQRQDLHAAVGESEVYDFLIDIVPRVTTAPKIHQPGLPAVPQESVDGSVVTGAMVSTTIPPGLQIPNAGLIAGLTTTIGQGTIPLSGGLDSTNMLHHMNMHTQQQQQQQQHYQTPQLQFQQQHPQHDQIMMQHSAQAAAGQAQQQQLPQHLLHQQHTTYVTIPQGTALATVTGVPTYLPPSSAGTSGQATTEPQWAPVPQTVDGGQGRGGGTSQ
jgi:histone H3/H4